ncbi:MAG: bis(5'-nucleosyl)-tetraphosphatase (symmetrical) YqeK [Candidatus Merdivicinus sp.]|jgi:predicted HD superfamily hydrolase involved in NAD metabolism
MTTRYPEYDALLQERLTPKRYRHSVNVMERAVELARIHGADPQKAELAGLIHDIEKNTSPKILLQSLQNSDILLTDADIFSPQLWHAPAGYLYARDVLGIDDADVLYAIRYHTTGRAGMSLLEKVVYLADLTSADRDFSDIREVRHLADVDLDAALFYSLQFILGDLVKHGKLLHPDSLACYHEIALGRARRMEP